jgi:hypothetical protein
MTSNHRVLWLICNEQQNVFFSYNSPKSSSMAICKGGQFHLQIDVNDSYCSNLGVLMATLQHFRSFQHYSQAEICCNFIVIAAAATLKILGFHTSKCKLAIINMVIIASLHRLL